MALNGWLRNQCVCVCGGEVFMNCCPCFSTDVHLSQRHHHLPIELHAVHDPGQFPPTLGGDAVQHVHLCVPLPPPPGHHDSLLHTHPEGDLEDSERKR